MTRISKMPSVHEYVAMRAKETGQPYRKYILAQDAGLSPAGITKLFRRVDGGANIRVDASTTPVTLWEKQDPWRKVGG